MRKIRIGLGSGILAGALLLAGCSTFKTPDDSAITSNIQAKLFNDPVLKAQDIRVSSQNGVVTLSGSVNTELEKAAAERFAAQQEGVKNVVNQLMVGSPAAQVAEASPAAETPASQAAEPTPPPERAEKPQRVRHHKTARTEQEVASLRPTNYAEGAASEAEPATQAASNPAPAAQTAAAPPASPAPAPQATLPPAPKPAEHLTIPSGTVVTIRTIDSIDSRNNRPGEEFAASVEAPIVVGDRVVVPRGSDARVRLVNAKSAGTMTGRSELQLELISMTVNGMTYATESGYYEQHGASRGKRTAETVGGGAVLGALVGGLLGHGKGAAIGAATGAGAGTVVQVATKGEQVKVPAETKLDFTLKAPVDVTLGSGA